MQSTVKRCETVHFKDDGRQKLPQLSFKVCLLIRNVFLLNTLGNAELISVDDISCSLFTSRTLDHQCKRTVFSAL